MNSSSMHWNAQQSGGKCRQGWRSNSVHKNSRYASLRSVAVTEKNRGAHRDEAKYSSGAARACEPAAPAHNGHAPQARIRRASGCYPFGVFFLRSCFCSSQSVLVSFSDWGANLKEQKLTILTPGLRMFQQRAGEAGNRDTAPYYPSAEIPRVSACEPLCAILLGRVEC